MKSNKLLAVDLAECALFVALMVVGAKLQIPFPLVPLTFQTVIAVLSGLLLGWQKGIIAMAVYMLMGLIGIPVFAGADCGFLYVLKPSFGYIIGFIVAAGVCGTFYNRTKKLWQIIVLAIAGFLANYAVGIPYFIAVWQLNGYPELWESVITYNLLYMPKDAALSLLAALLAWRVIPAVKRVRSRVNNPKESENVEGRHEN
ncbi:MAG: biotin transporter BioY [Candidatus Coproplasma sp.]